jgi:DNA polymerase-3 subunit delta'
LPLFSEILGQEKAIDFLKQVIARDKIPHGYLFIGIPGIGKTTTALALTQVVNCLDPKAGDACGQCRICRQMVGNNFPDIELIHPDGQSIKIEQIRNLTRSLSFKPLIGRYRVTIMRQAEKMTEESANAFLKTLEEPPESNILILNVAEPLDLLPTIVSRCQQVFFKPLLPGLISARLMKDKGLAETEAMVLAKIAGGSLGRALEMSENQFLKWRQDQLAGLIRFADLPLAEAMQTAWDYAGKNKKQDLDQDLFDVLSLWMTWYRDLLAVKSACSAETLINRDYVPELQNLAIRFNITRLVESVLALEQAQKDLNNSRNADLVMSHIVLSLKRAGRPF